MKVLTPSYAGENSVSGNGEDINKKPPMLYLEWCRKPNSNIRGDPMDNKSISHTRWKAQYHIVFISKYRKKVLYEKIRDDVREIISTLC